MQDTLNKIDFGYTDIDEAFPPCKPGVIPLGSRVMVQIRTPKRKTAGGILLTEEVRDTEIYNTQVAKVLACGPVAFHDRRTLQPWPEGHWAQPGDFVRIPRFGGDKWQVKTAVEGEDAILAIFNDLDLVAKVEDPLAVKAFL